MRSRLIVSGIVLLALTSSCQPAATPFRRAMTAWPAAVTETAEVQPAVITASSTDAWVHVRSQPSVESAPVGYGQVGDPVLILEAAAAADGYTWYRVRFSQEALVGWVREDLLDQSGAVSQAVGAAETPSASLKAALTERCGSEQALQAYFVTTTAIHYLCQRRRQLYYLSQEQGTDQVITSEAVEGQPDGSYRIENGQYVYRLDRETYRVERIEADGQTREILRDAVVYSEQY